MIIDAWDSTAPCAIPGSDLRVATALSIGRPNCDHPVLGSCLTAASFRACYTQRRTRER
jgi:hypothetical protein